MRLQKKGQPVSVVIICIFAMVHPDVLKHLVQGPETCKENLSALTTKVLCVFFTGSESTHDLLICPVTEEWLVNIEFLILICVDLFTPPFFLQSFRISQMK